MRIYITFILTAVFSYTIAQNTNNIDYNLNDTSQIYNALKKAKELSKSHPDSALNLYKNIEIASVRIGEKKVIMHSKYDYAFFLFMRSKHSQSRLLFEESMPLSKELRNYRYLNMAKTYISAIHLLLANYNLAVKYNLEALKYFEKEKDYFYISGIYLNLTFAQIEQKDYDKAIEYAELSLKYSILAGEKVYESKSFLNLGEIYSKKGDYSKSIFNYKKSLDILTENNLEVFKHSNIYLNIGATYVKMNMLDSADYYLKIASKTRLTDYTKTFLNITYSKLYKQKKEYDKALVFVENAEKSANLYGYDNAKREVVAVKSELYALKGNYKKAYENRLIYEKINDSIFSDEKYKIQNELETIYESSKKQEQIEKLSGEMEINRLKNQRSNYVLFFMVFALFGVVMIGILIFRQNRLKFKHTSIEFEQKLLRTQMNPHFIFNSVSAIQNFIMSNNPLEATTYLSDFAKLMRATLNNSSSNFISLEQEIETIENYLKLQHLRLSDKFDYEIKVPESIDPDEYTVPPMLLQPFIENSIIHAFSEEMNRKGLISVSYKINNNQLIMETQDNGIGFEKNKQNKELKHISKSGSITKKRIELLSKKFKKEIGFEIIDLNNIDANLSGTLVRFILPIN